MHWPRIIALIALGFAFAQSEPQARARTGGSNESRTGTGSQVSAQPDKYLISKSGIGPLRLGTTLEQARRALPSANFVRASDGDGVALVKVTLGANESMFVWAEEEDAAAPIDWSKKITTIETFSPAFHTAEGARPGTLVRQVEALLGKVKNAPRSEIESRVYVVFEAQPAYLTFRMDDVGPEDEAHRARVDPRARILSIAVGSAR